MKELATLLQDTREGPADGGSPVKQTAVAAPQQAVFRNAGDADSVCLISSPAERMLCMLDQLLNNEQVSGGCPALATAHMF